jgi:hypothetical protein
VGKLPKDWTGLVFNQIGNPNDPSPLEDVTLEKLGAAANFPRHRAQKMRSTVSTPWCW